MLSSLLGFVQKPCVLNIPRNWFSRKYSLSTEAIFTNSSRTLFAKCSQTYSYLLGRVGGGGGGRHASLLLPPLPLPCRTLYCTSVQFTNFVRELLVNIASVVLKNVQKCCLPDRVQCVQYHVYIVILYITYTVSTRDDSQIAWFLFINAKQFNILKKIYIYFLDLYCITRLSFYCSYANNYNSIEKHSWKPCCAAWPLKRYLFGKRYLFSLLGTLWIRALVCCGLRFSKYLTSSHGNPGGKTPGHLPDAKGLQIRKV